MSRWCSNQLSYAPGKGGMIPAMKHLFPLLVLAAMASVSCSPKAESIGEVDTVFKLL